MNFFKWLRGALKIRPDQVKVNHKDVPALDTLAKDANALTGAGVDVAEAKAGAVEGAAAASAEKSAAGLFSNLPKL